MAHYLHGRNNTIYSRTITHGGSVYYNTIGRSYVRYTFPAKVDLGIYISLGEVCLSYMTEEHAK